MLTGAAAGQLFAFYFPRHHIALFATDEPRLAILEARIDEPPRFQTTPHGKNGARTMQFGATTLRLLTVSGWEDTTGKLQISIAGEVGGLAAGGAIRVVGTLQRPLAASNPGQFDWAAYGRTQRLCAELSVLHASGVQVLPDTNWDPVWTARQRARAALDAGFSIAGGAGRELLAALVFGDRGNELTNVEEAFRRTGDTHLLASNGLRIAILASGLYLLCFALRLGPRRSVWLVTIAVALFAFLTLPAPQALRPSLLCAGVGIAIAARRRVDSVQLLSLAALLILSFNPLDLYAAGFQLSFVAVFGLMLFAGPVARWLLELEDPHRRAARGLFQASAGQRLRIVLWDLGRPVLAAAMVAWLIATPLVAFQFEQFNPWSIPIGVVLSPLVFIAMIAGFAKICLTLAFPWFASSWANVARMPADTLIAAVCWLAKIPADDIPMSSPPAGIIAAYYLLLCAPALGSLAAFNRLWDRIKPRSFGKLLLWSGRIVPPGLALLLLFLPVNPGARAPPGTLQLTLLSVGAGQSAVVELPDGRALMIDCGSSTLSDDLRQCLAPFLRHEGRSHLNAIYLSHGDYDHISAAAGAVEMYDVPDVFISPNFRVHARESAAAEGLLESLEEAKRPPQTLWVGQHIPLGDGAMLEVLWPPEHSALNSNNSALVLKLSYAGRSILFPADIQIPAERGLLQNPALLRSDILIAPHHGSREDTTAEFIAAVHPLFILSSNANRLTQKQRGFDALAIAHPLYRTSNCGALTVGIDAKGQIQLRGFVRLREEGTGGKGQRGMEGR